MDAYAPAASPMPNGEPGDAESYSNGSMIESMRQQQNHLVYKIQQMESEYRKRLETVDKEYDSRIRELAHVIMRAFRDLTTDPLLNNQRNNPTSLDIVANRINEILNSVIDADREGVNKELIKRFAQKESEALRWKKEYQRMFTEVKKRKLEKTNALKYSRELEHKDTSNSLCIIHENLQKNIRRFDQISALRDEISSVRSLAADRATELADARARLDGIPRLERQSDDLSARLVAAEARSQRAVEEGRKEAREENSQRVKELEGSLAAKTQEIVSLREKLARSEAEYKTAVVEAEKSVGMRYAQEITRLRSLVRSRDTALDAARKGINDHSSRSTTLSQRLREMSQTLADEKRQNIKLKQELERVFKSGKESDGKIAAITEEKEKMAAALRSSERERLALRRKYLSIGEKVEGLLREEDKASAHARELLEAQRSALKQELLAEKKARKHEHRVHRRAMKGLEVANTQLRESLAHAKRELKANEKVVRETERETAELKTLRREVSEKDAVIIKLRSEMDVQKARFLSDAAAAGREAQSKVEALAVELQNEKRAIHREYQRLLTEKADQLQRVLGVREQQLQRDLENSRRTVGQLRDEISRMAQLNVDDKKHGGPTVAMPSQKEAFSSAPRPPEPRPFSASLEDYLPSSPLSEQRRQKTNVRAMQSAKKAMQIEIKELKKELDSLKRTVGAARKDKKAAEERALTAEDTVAKLRRELGAAKKMLRDTESYHAVEDVTKEEVLENMKRAGENIRGLQRALEAERKKTRQMHKTLQAQAQAAARVMSLEKALFDKEEESARLSASERSEAERGESLSKEIAQVRAERNHLEAQLKESREEITKISSSHQSALAKVSTLEAALEAERSRIESQTRAHEKATKTANRLESELRQATNRLNLVKLDLECAREQVHALSASNKHLTAKIRKTVENAIAIASKTTAIDKEINTGLKLLVRNEVKNMAKITEGAFQAIKSKAGQLFAFLESENAGLKRGLILAQRASEVNYSEPSEPLPRTPPPQPPSLEDSLHTKIKLEAENAQLSSQVQDLESKLTDVREKESELRLELDQKNKVLEEKLHNNAPPVKEFEMLQQKCNAMEKNLIDTEAERSGLEADIHELSARVRELKSSIENMRERVLELLTPIAKLVQKCWKRKIVIEVRTEYENDTDGSDEPHSKDPANGYEEAIKDLIDAVERAVRNGEQQQQSAALETERLEKEVKKLQEDKKTAKENSEKWIQEKQTAETELKQAKDTVRELKKELRSIKLNLRQLETEKQVDNEVARLSVAERFRLTIQELQRELNATRDKLEKEQSQRNKEKRSRTQRKATSARLSLVAKREGNLEDEFDQSTRVARPHKDDGNLEDGTGQLDQLKVNRQHLFRRMKEQGRALDEALSASLNSQTTQSRPTSGKRKMRPDRDETGVEADTKSQPSMGTLTSDYQKGLHDIEKAVSKARNLREESQSILQEVQKEQSVMSQSVSSHSRSFVTERADKHTKAAQSHPSKPSRKKFVSRIPRPKALRSFTRLAVRPASLRAIPNRNVVPPTGVGVAEAPGLSVWELERSRRSDSETNKSPDEVLDVLRMCSLLKQITLPHQKAETFAPDDNDFQLPDRSPRVFSENASFLMPSRSILEGSPERKVHIKRDTTRDSFGTR